MKKTTIDYLLKKISISFWKKVKYKATDLGISIKQLILDALKEKIRKK